MKKTMYRHGGIWIETNETIEFLDNLTHVSFLLKAAIDNNLKWKWVILSLHNLMESILLCHLRGNETTNVLVLDKRGKKELLKRMNEISKGAPLPNDKIAPMKELYSRVKNSNLLPKELTLKITTEHDAAISILNELRNDFDHYLPGGLSVEISGLPSIVRDCCEIIEQLAIKKTTFYSRLPDHKESIISLLEEIRGSLLKIESNWENIKQASTGS